MREVERVGHANQSENWPQQHRPLKQFVQNLLASALQLIDLIQNQNSEIQWVKLMQQKTLGKWTHIFFLLRLKCLWIAFSVILSVADLGTSTSNSSAIFFSMADCDLTKVQLMSVCRKLTLICEKLL
jgi:hypothetical protein